MADFERLIKKALSSQDATSADVRQMVYQSSRNALQKIIDGNRNLTVEAVMTQKQGLEECIEKIELEYTMPRPPVPAPISEPVSPPTPVEQSAPTPEPQPEIVPEPQLEPQPKVEPKVEPVTQHPLDELQQILHSTSPSGDPFLDAPTKPLAEPQLHAEPSLQATNPTVEAPVQVANVEPQSSLDPVIDVAPERGLDQPDDYYDQPQNVPIGFEKRRKTQKRIFWVIINLLILALLAWIIYIVATGFYNNSLFGQNDGDGRRINPNTLSQQENSEDYITVIDSGDLSSLVMAGRGKAELVNQLNSEMIRIHSTRDAANRSQPAEPILIRLKPGVLGLISGKRVTVEIYAKSGSGEQAHFSVGCEFGSLTECGRKRFLAGPQPSASVFAFQMDRVTNPNQDIFLTLSTDTTKESAITGKGDTLDLAYIRLSYEE